MMMKSKDNCVPFDNNNNDLALTSLSGDENFADSLPTRDPGQGGRPPPIPMHAIVLETASGSHQRERQISRTVQSFHLGKLDSAKTLEKGCGKTSLLNAISFQHQGKNQVQTGTVFVNNAPVDLKKFIRSTGYVRQKDILMETLTPRESVNFVIDITKHIDVETRRATADRVLGILGLETCADRMIGGRNVKGISGGERKRTSIAVEIVSNPRLILLDEPTSALDSSTAEAVVLSLRKLANEGRTIMASFHQPTHALFKLFDRVLLLSGGRTAYFGSPQDSIQYFGAIGFTLPPYTNPCEFFNNSRDMGQARRRISTILDQASHLPTSAPSSPGDVRPTSVIVKAPAHRHRARIAWCLQLKLLVFRNVVNFIRQPKLMRVRLIKAICSGLLCGILFSSLGHDQKSIRDRGGAAFFLMLSAGMGSALDAVRTMPEEHEIVTKEFYQLYHPSAYFTSKALSDLPFILLQCLLNCCIAYPMVGFQTDLTKFAIFLLIMALGMSTCDALGVAIGCAFPNPQVAAASASILLMPLVVFSGYLVHTESVSVALRWIEYISPFKYALGALAINELDGLTLYCTDSEYIRVDDGRICPMTTGAAAMDNMFSLKPSDLWPFIMANVLIFICLRIIGLLLLTYHSRSSPKRASKPKSRRIPN